MSVARRWVIGLASLLGVSVLFLGLTFAGIGPLAKPEFIETHWTPSVVAASDGSDNLSMITIGFPWPKQGYCAGQFSVKVTETAATVTLGQVLSQEPNRGQDCGGIGSDGKSAVVAVPLGRPLAKRAVVRASDRRSIPVISLTALYQGRWPTA